MEVERLGVDYASGLTIALQEAVVGTLGSLVLVANQKILHKYYRVVVLVEVAGLCYGMTEAAVAEAEAEMDSCGSGEEVAT